MSTPRPDLDRTLRIDVDEATYRRAPLSGRGQYAPGTVVAGRYHVAGVLGAGGMGEVYRAEDAKLGQTVALKFLPATMAREPLLLARLHDEVRLGRQVAHPNVCRIYDIGEWGDAHFVTMEFVDGEDLARLLRRIGRLPQDKGVEIARGIAGGLAAAHAKGIIHRDLKPANVMIDSDGYARITDFGLAMGIEETDGSFNAGTPAYMAPEQLEGQPATVRSDVYALGLVLYELFTGRRTFGEAPSSIVHDIDPPIERLILRCLERDPALRPRSAREVLETLPGGDPIAAAIAAGETPSPRAIAAANVEGRLSRAAAWSWLGAIVAFTIAQIFIQSDNSAYVLADISTPPVVLEARASEMLRALGIAPQPQRANGLDVNADYVAWISQHDTSPDRFRRRLAKGPPAVRFWMRQSATPLTPRDDETAPTLTNPPNDQPSMTTIELDPRGRLVALDSRASGAPRAVDWKPLLAAAGLDAASLTPAEPHETPAMFADARAAWTGRHPDDGTPVRIEAASQRGLPVFFRLTGPWDEAEAGNKLPFRSRGLLIFMFALVTSVVLVALFLAWHNLRARRGDRQGTIRLGVFIFVCNLGAAIIAGDHRLALLHEIAILSGAIAKSLFWASLFMVLYAAGEPYLRRRWPDRLISWSRLLRGDVKDPLVGRDLLIGTCAGVAHGVLAIATYWLPSQLTTVPGPLPHAMDRASMGGFRSVLALVLRTVISGAEWGLIAAIVLVVFTLVLRRRALAGLAVFALQMLAYGVAIHDLKSVPFYVVIALMLTLLIVRVGILGFGAMIVAFNLTFNSTLTILPGGWNAPSVFLLLAALAALTLYAFRTALGGQPAFRAGLLDG